MHLPVNLRWKKTKLYLLCKCHVFSDDEDWLPPVIKKPWHLGGLLSTGHAGIAEAVEEDVTGLLVDEGNVEDMAKAFLQVIPVTSDLGNAGYQRAAAKFMWDHEKTRLNRWLFGLD